MREDERLYEIIEEAARTKKPIQLKPEDSEFFRLTMYTNTKALVEDLYWQDERKHIYQAVVEAGFERNSGFFTTGFYVCGNQCLEGFGSGRTNMFRQNNRYIAKEDDVHEQDNIPNPFVNLTLEELYFLREHKNLLDKICLEKGVCNARRIEPLMKEMGVVIASKEEIPTEAADETFIYEENQ